MFRGAVILLILFGATAQNIVAQVVLSGYAHRHWTIEEGLPINEVSDIEQTRDGYIWLSTYDGLVRFDGNRFTLFNKGNTSGIISNRLQGFRKSESDDLFILTDAINGSEHLILFRDNQFRSFELGINDLRSIISISFYENNELRIVNNFRILRFDGTDFVPAYEDVISEKVYAISPTDDQAMWVSTDKGVLKVKDQVVQRFAEEDGLISEVGNRILQDSQGRLWVNNESGIQFIKGNKVTRVPIPRNNRGLEYMITNGFEDKSRPGRVLFLLSQDYYLAYYNGETQLIPPGGVLSEDINNEFRLVGSDSVGHAKSWQNIGKKLYHNGKLVFENGSKINEILEDGKGGTWVATDEGLHHFTEKLFTSFSAERGGISNTYPLLEDNNGHKWTANLAGDILSYNGRTWRKVDDVGADRVFSLYEDSNGDIWAGKRPGLLKYDRDKGGGFEDVSTPFVDLITQIRAIFEDSKGNVWVGSRHGLFSFTTEKEWIRFISDTPDKEIRAVRVIHEARDGTLWMGTNGSGLFYLRNGSLRSFEASERLSDTIIRSIHEDGDGILWIGLEGGGLDRIAFTDGEISITNYGLPEGLFDTVIHIILEDDHGRFWMSSNRGIFWVDKAELNAFAQGEIDRIHSTFYNEQDGLPGREANGGMQNTGIKTSDGNFWFSMVGGVATINPDEVVQNQTEVPSLVESVIAGDSTINNPQDGIRVEKDQRDLQFVYTAFNYEVKPENILFRYRLRGYIDNWIYAGARREGFFTSVDAGSYTFEVQASIDGANWDAAGSTLAVTIAPYFYETNVFWGLLVIGGIALLITGFRVRTAQLYKRQQELERTVLERTEDLNNEKQEVERQKELVEELSTAKDHFFTNISHELRTPLTLVLGPLQKLSDKKADLKDEWRHHLTLANRNGRRLKQLVEQVLDLARLDSDKLELSLSKVDVRSVTKLLAESFESLAESKGSTLSVTVPQNPLYAALDVDKYQKILTNLISNAIKFTAEKGSIRVGLANEDDELVLSVSDTGKGIDKDRLPYVFDRFHSNEERIAGGGHGLGVGLNLTKEFVELHQGSIRVTSDPGVETTFTVRLPIQEHLLADLEEVEIEEKEPVQEAHTGTQFISKQSIEPDTRILIVEDNHDMRAYIHSLLAAEDIEVSEAENGVEGKKRVSLAKPDLIISDVMMPDMDGFAFVEFVRSVPELRLTPIVMLTALAGIEDRIQALDLGVSDYLTKPFHEEELIARVRNLLRLKKEREEILPTEEPEDVSEATLFVKKLQAYVEERISNSEITVEELSDAANASRRQLYYKIKSTTGFTPAEFVREIRLTKARQLIEGKRKGTISEIAYAVGFSTPTYFTKLFIERFGSHPKELL